MKFAYVGDGNNMTHSLMIGGAKTGMDVMVACPEGYMPNAEIVALAQQYAAEYGGSVSVGMGHIISVPYIGKLQSFYPFFMLLDGD